MFRTSYVGVALLALASAASAQTAQDLFPVHNGNEWKYDLAGSTATGQRTMKITQRSGGWAEVDGLEGKHWWWMSAQSGRIWVWNTSTRRYSQAFDLGAAQGSDFTADADDVSCLDGAVYRVTDRNKSVNTPAGTFNGCVEITMRRNPCADAGIQHMVFAPSVGLIQYSWQTIAGPQTATLSYAKVDGREYKRQQPTVGGGLSVAAATDKFGYTSGGTLNIKFDVKNGSGNAVGFVFNSGQSFDFIIKDRAGTEVYRWSHGRFFTMALRGLSLLPGETWSYTQAIKLEDRNGAPLAAGDYVIEAIQTAGLGHMRMRASVYFTIN